MLASLVVTHNCNLRCGYCFTGEKKNKDMSPEIGKKAVDFIFSNLKNDNKVTLNFFGGEPLLCYETIKEIINYSNSVKKENVNLSYAITTNGTIFKPEMKEFLIKNKVSFILSVDGDEKTQNQYRKTISGEGSYKLLENNLKNWLDLQNNSLKITIRMTIDIANVEGLFKSIVYLNKLGFKNFAYAPNIHDGWEENSIKAVEEQYHKIGEYYIECLLNGISFSCANIEKYVSCSITNTMIGCMAGINKFAVSPAGNIYPCHAFVREDSDPEMIIGDIISGFYRKKTEFFEAEKSNSECTMCKVKKRCACVCPFINYKLTGDIHQKHWFSCKNERLSIEVSDYVSQVLFEKDAYKFLEHIFGPRNKRLTK